MLPLLWKKNGPPKRAGDRKSGMSVASERRRCCERPLKRRHRVVQGSSVGFRQLERACQVAGRAIDPVGGSGDHLSLLPRRDESAVRRQSDDGMRCMRLIM
jgi:hypothetical protein